MELDIEETKRKIKDHFDNISPEELEKNLEYAGNLPCLICGLRKAKDCDCKI